MQTARFEAKVWGPSNLAVQASDTVQADAALAALADQLQYCDAQGQYPNAYWDYTWVVNVRQNVLAQKLIEQGIRPKSMKDDIKSLADEQYYKTLLAVPLLGIVVFTVIPIFFMILIAFTNYDYAHLPPEKLFDWVGFENFKTMLATDIKG